MTDRAPQLSVSLVLLVLIVSLCGCSLTGWRVGQKKVPLDTGPSIESVESQRRAAALIADLSASVSFDPGKQISDIHAVAVPLSASLGEPLKRAAVFQAPDVVAALRKSTLDAQAKAQKWQAFSVKYAGTPLEDTGINLAGPAGFMGLIGVVALCIMFPPVGYLLLRVLPVLWGYFVASTNGIANFVASNPRAGADLKAQLSRKLDTSHKRLVKKRATPADMPEPVMP